MDAAYNDPELRFLWHPGTNDIFSGYGLATAPAHLVGLLLVDRPEPVDAHWLETIAHVFGSYQLTAMTTGGERGLVCQMRIAEESIAYVRVLPYPHLDALRDVLVPLLEEPPAVTLHLTWSADNRCWLSHILEPRVPLFSLGMSMGTGARYPKQIKRKMIFRSSTAFASSRPIPCAPASASGYSPRQIGQPRPSCFPMSTDTKETYG